MDPLNHQQAFQQQIMYNNNNKLSTTTTTNYLQQQKLSLQRHHRQIQYDDSNIPPLKNNEAALGALIKQMCFFIF